MKLLNLGCGKRIHTDWTNIDFVSTLDGVIAHNLTQGIPFPDNSFDVVYHSHVLEHFSQDTAKFFIAECYRVLRPQGVLRIAIPDLEQIAKTYLHALDGANAGAEDWAANYDWILLEMYDQTVRNCPGGEMVKYFQRETVPNEQFVLERCGVEAKKMIQGGYHHWEKTVSTESVDSKNPVEQLVKSIYRTIRYPTTYGRNVLNNGRESILKVLLGSEYDNLQIGRFRQRGEIHQWMYDRYSLRVILESNGFSDVVPRLASESYIPDWKSFNLDTEPDGSTYKPDSLYMEAIKQ